MATASVSSMEAFPMVGLALQLEVPTTAASILGPQTTQITLIICYKIELDKLSIYEILMCSIRKMCG
jgi:hypothetical protein